MSEEQQAQEEELPSLQLSVRRAETAQNASGMYVGTIHLVCVTKDRGIFDEAVQHLDGYKMYGAATEDVILALTAELKDVEDSATSLARRNKVLERQLKDKDAELAGIRASFSAIGAELGFDD
jgi:hypothetical protein